MVKLYDSFGLDIPYGEMHARCTAWNPELSLKELPVPAREIFLGHAHEMHEELKTNKHSVGVDPAPDPQHSNHGVRVVRSFAPRWYSEIYSVMSETAARIYSFTGERVGKPPGTGRPRFVEVSNCERNYVLAAFERIGKGRDGKYMLIETDKPKKWQPDRNGKLVHWTKVPKPTLFKVRKRFSYDRVVRDKIHERLTEGYYEGKDWVPGDVRVCTFWGLEEDLRNILLVNGGLEGLTDPAEIQTFRDLGGVELDKRPRKSAEEPPEGCPF